MAAVHLAAVIFSYLSSLATEMSLVNDNSNHNCCVFLQATLIDSLPKARLGTAEGKQPSGVYHVYTLNTCIGSQEYR